MTQPDPFHLILAAIVLVVLVWLLVVGMTGGRRG